MVWVVEDRSTAVLAARMHQPEVAIVELGFQECSGPAVAMQVTAAARHLATIFLAGPRDEGEVAAARTLGLGRVISGAELLASLDRILFPLAECVRLRRRMEEAEHRLQQVTLDDQSHCDRRRVTLPEAERRYRETYVRSLLAETGNRREAARRAGVPYTTLCEIIRKLGIPSNDPRA
jgi:hypothetical protein